MLKKLNDLMIEHQEDLARIITLVSISVVMIFDSSSPCD